MVTVKNVMRGSIASRAGFMPGDIILSINGNNINDVLDYRFYLSECSVDIKVHRGPDLLNLHIEKDEYDDIGLDFETFLMDEKRSCRNKCIFCFIDQLPSGMRDTLYFKDDDSRLSFLQGNYITLTNLSDEDVERICKMKMSPMNISVHTTSPELRCTMMKNRFAGNVMEILGKFAEAGIKIHAQIVLCKGVNDGDELTRSMRDLSALYPAL
ncbi:MAG: PDZ domain-containing protein, partial [Clostridia bacterium]|nr:PDZ domain-containing protein [Clostridia bacterium]